MRWSKYLVALCILLLLPSPLMAQDVSADGMTMGYQPATMQWSTVMENAQLAIINFDGSYEDLMLEAFVSTGALRESSQIFWLYPIPSEASHAVIGIYDSFPVFGGHILDEYARFSMTEDFALIYSSQIYPIPFALGGLYTVNDNPFYQKRVLSPGGGQETSSTSGVDIFQHIEQYGLSAELIDTSDSDALNQYMASRGISLPFDSIGIIQDYVDEGYSFVASWISNVDDYMSNVSFSGGPGSAGYGLSVEVTFPTDRAYYPMRLTSVYGSEEIPVVLEIVGCVEPDVDDEVVSYLDLETYYCMDPEYEISPNLEAFYPNLVISDRFHDGAVSNLVFTLVLGSTQAENMKDDLWFQTYDSPEVNRATFMLDYGWAVLIGTFFGISMLSSLSSGWLNYRKEGPLKGKFALLGLANATTIVGFALVARHLQIDHQFVSSPKEGPPPRWKRFVWTFSFIFLSLTFACHMIINHVVL